MGYFEHVQRKTEEVNPYASVASMVERVEQRAYEALSPKEQQATEYACVDPYVAMSPQDSALWVVALTKGDGQGILCVALLHARTRHAAHTSSAMGLCAASAHHRRQHERMAKSGGIRGRKTMLRAIRAAAHTALADVGVWQ